MKSSLILLSIVTFIAAVEGEQAVVRKVVLQR